MKFLFLSSGALLGAWLMQPALQVEHEPVAATPTGTTTAPSNDDQPAQKPTTKNGGTTMR